MCAIVCLLLPTDPGGGGSGGQGGLREPTRTQTADRRPPLPPAAASEPAPCAGGAAPAAGRAPGRARAPRSPQDRGSMLRAWRAPAWRQVRGGLGEGGSVLVLGMSCSPESVPSFGGCSGWVVEKSLRLSYLMIEGHAAAPCMGVGEGASMVRCSSVTRRGAWSFERAQCLDTAEQVLSRRQCCRWCCRFAGFRAADPSLASPRDPMLRPCASPTGRHSMPWSAQTRASGKSQRFEPRSWRCAISWNKAQR